jgi:hypothetical protein
MANVDVDESDPFLMLAMFCMRALAQTPASCLTGRPRRGLNFRTGPMRSTTNITITMSHQRWNGGSGRVGANGCRRRQIREENCTIFMKIFSNMSERKSRH